MNDAQNKPYPTEEDGAMYWVNVSREEYEQDSYNVQTEFAQGSDSVQTECEQDSDNVRTLSVQRQDKNQTAVARGSKRPNETHYSVYKENTEIVKLLINNKFVRVNTSGTYNSIEDLPLSKAPTDLTAAVQRCGYPVSRNELAKIYTAANVCRRVPRWKVWTLCVFVAVVSVYGCIVYGNVRDAYFEDGGTSSNVMVASVGGTGDAPPDIGSIISDFERRKTFKFYPFRREVISKQIKESGDYSAANCEIILQQNMAAQIQATKKK